MKTKSILFSVLAVLAVTLTSCWEISAPEQVFDEADLLGVWCPASDLDTVPVVFVRFTNETDSTGEYKYGREWDESEDISRCTPCTIVSLLQHDRCHCRLLLL